MKRLHLIFLALPAFSCCSDDNSNGESALRETSVILKVQNVGETSNYLNAIDTDNIRIQYREEDELVTVLTGGDHPYGYYIFEEPPVEGKMIKVFCYTGGNKENEETFINWDGVDIDTLSYKVSRFASGNVVISQIKFNGDVITPDPESGMYGVAK